MVCVFLLDQDGVKKSDNRLIKMLEVAIRVGAARLKNIGW